AAHQLAERRPRPLHQPARDRRLRGRPRLLLDPLADRLLRPRVTAAGNAGQHPLQHHARERILVGELTVAGKLDLTAAPGAPDARTLDRDAAAAQRDLARLMAVPVRRTRRLVPALTLRCLISQRTVEEHHFGLHRTRPLVV